MINRGLASVQYITMFCLRNNNWNKSAGLDGCSEIYNRCRPAIYKCTLVLKLCTAGSWTITTMVTHHRGLAPRVHRLSMDNSKQIESFQVTTGGVSVMRTRKLKCKLHNHIPSLNCAASTFTCSASRYTSSWSSCLSWDNLRPTMKTVTACHGQPSAASASSIPILFLQPQGCMEL